MHGMGTFTYSSKILSNLLTLSLSRLGFASLVSQGSLLFPTRSSSSLQACYWTL